MDVNYNKMIYSLFTIVMIVFCMSFTTYAHSQELQNQQQKDNITSDQKYQNAKFLDIVDTSDKIQYTDEELICLAKNIYYEAGGEKSLGKIAVAQVTINRSRDAKFSAKTICGVVFAPYQFDWARHKHTRLLIPKGPKWDDCLEIAKTTLEGRRVKGIEHALFFHDSLVHPRWKHAILIARIGTQMFYSRG